MSDLDAHKTISDITKDVSEASLVFNDYENDRRVLTTLQLELKHCRSFCFSVAFITHGGLSCLKQQIIDSKDIITGRIITTDYLNFNEPKALRDLLRFPNIQVRMYTSEGFHTKGYLFDKDDETTLLIGSSNLTQDALNRTKEWNVKVSNSDSNSAIVDQTRSEFERMWNEAVPLTEEWIAEYEPRHIKSKIERDRSTFPDSRYPDVIKPNVMQEEALQNLSRIRSSGKDRALLISATGTGKTYLSAFDVRESGARKVLFLVHREQILDDARESFRNILGHDISTGKIGGGCKDFDADFIFSTIASMSNPDIYSRFDPEYFEYIICDEAHHSVTNTYNSIMDYFHPKFFLGMTATPERMDGRDVFEKFNHTIAYEIRLKEALKRDMLCPFHYFGIADIEVDGKPLSDDEDFNSLVSDERVHHIIEKAELYGYSGTRVKGLIFCSRVDEAQELSSKLNMNGLRTACLSGRDSAETRENCVQRLEKDTGDDCLDYILTVDIFNEGVDIRSVNQIIMLRPTQSATIFIQQLGRGLRKMTRDNVTKEYLVVIDFIGNYQNNFLIPIALTGDSSMSTMEWKKKLMIANEGIPGCSTVDFDIITKERIYESIDMHQSPRSMMKSEYGNLVKIYGYGPSLLQLYKMGKIDPYVLSMFYKNLNQFRTILRCEHVNYTEEEDSFLTFVSTKFVNGVRPHELLILGSIIRYGSATLDDLRKSLENYGLEMDQSSLDSAISGLNGVFYNNCFDEAMVMYRDGCIIPTNKLSSLLGNDDLRRETLDVVDTGLCRFEDKYLDMDPYGFKPFGIYCRSDVCRILNWEKDDASTVYGYQVKFGTCPIFVTYHKKEDISETTKYMDSFIDRQTFSWMTRSGGEAINESAQNIWNNRVDSYLFITKSNNDKVNSTALFYYMGKVHAESHSLTSMKNKKGEDVKVTNIIFKLEEPVPQQIYDYIVGE